jgi:hypothetical protein
MWLNQCEMRFVMCTPRMLKPGGQAQLCLPILYTCHFKSKKSVEWFSSIAAPVSCSIKNIVSPYQTWPSNFWMLSYYPSLHQVESIIFTSIELKTHLTKVEKNGSEYKRMSYFLRSIYIYASVIYKLSGCCLAYQPQRGLTCGTSDRKE